MNNKAFNVSLSLTENNIQVIKGIVQFDDANLLRIKVMSNGEAFDFTGYTDVVLTIKKPDGTYIITEQTQDSDYIQSFDPEVGEVHLQLGGQATIIPGMHFASISFYGSGMRATTAKMNYFVTENVGDGELPEELTSSNDWAALNALIAANSGIQTAESARVAAELARIAAEIARASESQGLVAQATAFSNAAQQYSEIARSWAAVTFATAIPGDYWNFFIGDDGILYIDYDDALYPEGYTLPAITTEQLEARLAAINCGTFNNTVDQIQILRGSFADLPVLEDGEMAWASDTKQMYIGTEAGNEAVSRSSFVAQATAPSDTTMLWIDTAHNNVIKFHNGSAWIGTSTATFA